MEPTVDPATRREPLRRSFRANSAARFLSDTYILVNSLVAATITARLLGPAGKGFYSTIILLSSLLVLFFNLGLGEAAIVLAGRARAVIRTATSATMMAVLPLSVVGAFSFFALASQIVRPATSNQRAAVILGTVLVLFNVCSTTVAWFLVLEERIVLVAELTAFSATVSTVALWYLVAGAGYGSAGAVAASLLGCLVVLLAMLVFLRRTNTSLRPQWDAEYLRSAVRFGAAVQMSNLLVQMTGRVDLVLVYRLAGPADAGTYSIALTIGALVGGVPIALAFASFPRLAQLQDAEADAFTLQLFRMGVVAAVGSAIVLAFLTPILVPLVFGRAYGDSITPTLILVVAGVFWSGQWILSRAAAARRKPKALLLSFALSFITMVGIDFILIGRLGGTGAAIASMVGSLLGFLVAASFYRNWDWRGFVPTWDDCTFAAGTGRNMLAGVLKRKSK